MKLLKLLSKALYKVAKILDSNSTKSNEFVSNVTVPDFSMLNLSELRMKDDCFVEIGEHSQVPGSLVFDREKSSITTVGKRSFINGTVISADSVSMGDDVLISWGVTIADHTSHAIAFSNRSQDAVDWLEGRKDWTHVKTASVKIHNKAWIGYNSTILKGVRIGKGSMIAACSVVNKDVPNSVIVVGNPEKIIKEL